MTKKLLGLTAALGITALAAWAVPAVAGIGSCTGRYCLSNPGTTLCRCLQSGQVITCASWRLEGCSAP
jgi:hypothetical protein